MSERALRAFAHFRAFSKRQVIHIRKVQDLAAHHRPWPSFSPSLCSYLYVYVMDNSSLLDARISLFRTCSAAEILRLVSTGIPEDRLPVHFLQSLSEEDRTVCYRVCMICWTITNSTMVPREMQFRVVLANYHRKDVLVWELVVGSVKVVCS
jgi:hypothetical protein